VHGSRKYEDGTSVCGLGEGKRLRGRREQHIEKRKRGKGTRCQSLKVRSLYRSHLNNGGDRASIVGKKKRKKGEACLASA